MRNQPRDFFACTFCFSLSFFFNNFILSNSGDSPRAGIFRVALKGDAPLKLSPLSRLSSEHAGEAGGREMRRIYCRHKVHPTEIASVPVFPTADLIYAVGLIVRPPPAAPRRTPLFTLYLLWLASPRSECEYYKHRRFLFDRLNNETPNSYATRADCEIARVLGLINLWF